MEKIRMSIFGKIKLMHPKYTLVLLGLLSICGYLNSAEVSYQGDIEPILKASCYKCHGPKKQKYKLRLDAPFYILKGSKDGEVLFPGDPKKSPLYTLVTLPKGDEEIMPPKDDPLTKEQQEKIRLWILQGASFGSASLEEPKASAATEPQAVFDSPSPTALKKIQTFGGIADRVAANSNEVDVDLRFVSGALNEQHLMALQELAPQLTSLNLAGTKITDQGLQHIAKLKQLRRLHLQNTEISDKGLEALKSLTELRYLNLHGTKIEAAGLQHLTGLKKLQKIFLWNTKVTRQDIETLQTALPDLDIYMGLDIETAALKKDAADSKESASKDLHAFFDPGSCCHKAHQNGQPCGHSCCKEAAAKNEVCFKCNKKARAKWDAEK